MYKPITLSLLLAILCWNPQQLFSQCTDATAICNDARPINSISSEILLPDGSAVTLNANSKLQYYTHSARKVWLEGEAFFEVKKIPETAEPFQVVTNDLTITVLGTTFNVNSRNEQTKHRKLLSHAKYSPKKP